MHLYTSKHHSYNKTTNLNTYIDILYRVGTVWLFSTWPTNTSTLGKLLSNWLTLTVTDCHWLRSLRTECSTISTLHRVPAKELVQRRKRTMVYGCHQPTVRHRQTGRPEYSIHLFCRHHLLHLFSLKRGSFFLPASQWTGSFFNQPLN